MGDNKLDTLRTWLKDAYAMEQGIVEVLERQIDNFEGMPDAQTKLREHLGMTQGHAERVRACIERLGDDVSTAKSAFANVVGALQGMATALATDKVIKDAMASYAIEHFEIASYKVLVSAAEELGQDEIAKICKDIMDEEQDMANWLGKQIPEVTKQHLLTVVES